MATYVHTLDGSPVLPKRKANRITLFGNGADQCRFVLDSPDGSLTAERGDPFSITENGTTIFAGEVKTARRKWLRSKDWAGEVTEVDATSYDDYTSRRIVEDTFAAGTLKALLTTLVDDYLDDYGVALHASQADGPSLPDLTWTRVQLKDVLDELATRTGYAWRIDYDKKLRMMPPSANACPFDIADDDGNVIGDLVRTPTQEDTYANRIIGVFSGAGPATYSETITFDGSATLDYEAKFPAPTDANTIWPNVILLNGGPSSGPIGFNDGTSAWQWVTAVGQKARLVLDGTGLVPANGDTFIITYQIAYPFSLEASDAGEITAHGPWDKVVEIPEQMTLDAAQAYVDAVLAESIIIPENITYQTYQTGILPGQRQHIQNTERDLDDDVVITSVVIEDVGRADNLFRRSVTAVLGDSIKGKWTTTYERMFDAGGSSKVAISGGGASPGGSIYDVQTHGAAHDFYGDAGLVHDFDGGGNLYGVELLPATLAVQGSDTKLQLALKNEDLSDAKALTFWQESDGSFFIEMQAGGAGNGSLNIQTYGTGDPYVSIGSADRILLGSGGVEAGVVATYQFCTDGLSLRDFQWSSGSKTVDDFAGIGTHPYSIFRYTGSGSVTLNLAAIAALTSRVESVYARTIAVIHDGTGGTLTLDPNSTETIGNGSAAASTMALTAGQAVLISMISGTGGGVKILASHGFSGSGTPGGSDTYVQYNDGSAFGGDANLVWDKTKQQIQVQGDTADDDATVRIVNESTNQSVIALQASNGVSPQITFGREFVGGVDTARHARPAILSKDATDMWMEMGVGETPGSGMAFTSAAGMGFTTNGMYGYFYAYGIGTGAVAGPAFEIGRSADGNGAAGSLKLVDKAGTAYYLWVESGKLRIHTSPPTEDNSTVAHTAGTVVGSQS